MRTASGILAAWGLMWLTLGCAQAPKTATVAPTSEELPQYKELDPTIYAIVDVEHRGNESRVPLVPEFKEPPLTAKEKAALGETGPKYKFLLYPAPQWWAGTHVAPWDAGVTALPYGYGGAGATFGGLVTPMAGVGGGRAELLVGTDTFGSSIAASGGRTERISGVGGNAGVDVGTGPASKVADHKSRFDR